MKHEIPHPPTVKTPQEGNPASVALAPLIGDTDEHECRDEGVTLDWTISERRVSGWRIVSLVVALCLAFVHGHAQEAARVSFVKALESVYEYEPEVTVEVRRTGDLEIEASVLVSSQPVTGAVPEEDYEPISQWLVFSPGQTSAWITVAIINDGHPEPTETFRLILEEPGPNTELGMPAALRISILDNDGTEEPGSLRVPLGGDRAMDWSIEELRWRQGYPRLNVSFDTDEAIRFSDSQGGGQRQLIANVDLSPGTPAHDNPAFTDVYPTTLPMLALIADVGTVTLTFHLEYETILVDLIIADVDENDLVEVAGYGQGASPGVDVEWAVAAEGDLSRFINAAGRTATELASPPIWDSVTGQLRSAVTWNENRSFTVLRPSFPVHTITVRFTGAIANVSGSGFWGAHVYVALWATPRPFRIVEIRPTLDDKTLIHWPSLPGVPYRLFRSPDMVNWTEVGASIGPPAPALTTEAILPSSMSENAAFFRLERW
jgi:hypothetical protein